MKLDINKVFSHWVCTDCGTEADWTFVDCAESGEPVCCECDCVMELSDDITVTDDAELNKD